jgi:hypothetical protein
VVGVIGCMQKGGDLLWCFSVVAHSDQALDRMQATQDGVDILSILPLLPSHKNTFEYSDPGGR